MKVAGRTFDEIWLVDFEFHAPAGEKPQVICLVARELGTDRLLRLWHDEIGRCNKLPYRTDRDCLFVAYYASAEIGCHLCLGWPLPENILDLYTEFRLLTNGLSSPCGNGLLGALAWHGLDTMASQEKTAMRDLAIRGGPFTADEKAALLDYCQSDVDALARLLPPMEETLDLPHALLRGRYMRAAARMEQTGVPMDVPLLERLRDNWGDLKSRLRVRIDADYGVYEKGTFKQARFAEYLARNDIPWPYLDSGALDLKDDTFRDMVRTYPQLGPLKELRVSLGQMRLEALEVGSDGRNRCMLSAFRSRTGRNQPSNKKFIFGPAVWMRGLIRPEPGWGLAYIDWSQQEFGIAAALSGDKVMQDAYTSGDPYLTFAMQAGAVPMDANKASHPQVREQFKACALAVQYGMGAEALALKIAKTPFRGRELLALHKTTYRDFWRWSQAALDTAMLKGSLPTVFGWRIRIGGSVNPRSIQNFPMQGNGAEMLRLACCLVTEQGIRVCAPVHDALLIEAPLAELDDTVKRAQELMAEASRIVLDGFSLRSDVELIRYPDRYADERGKVMWKSVMDLLDEDTDG
jgi:DNA polymerase-1